MDFPYTTLPGRPDGAFPDRKILKRPIVEITLRKGDRSIQCEALIDSGADYCLFPATLALALGITIPNNRSSAFAGTANATQFAYFETIQATIWNSSQFERPITFDLYAGFCETLEHIGIGLLGQQDFFPRFNVTFELSDNLSRVV